MGRLNNWIKAIVLNFNTIFSLVGLSIIGLAIFVLVNDWGSLDHKFFLGWGILSVFFGFFVYLASTVGYLGVRFQARRSGMWRGRRIIGLYQFILLACLIVELWWVIKLASAVKSMDVTQDALRSGKVITYDALEVNLANRFNEFFFGAAGSCADPKYVFYWSWIDGHCDVGMQQRNCECNTEHYAVVTCIADQTECYSTPDENGPQCPYEICRENILNYLVSRITPIYYYILIFSAFHISLMILSCALMCYTERDSLQTMLIKSGTISQTNVRGGQAEEKDDKKDADKKKKKSTSREKKPDQTEIAAREMLGDEESSELASPNKHRRGHEHGHERGHEHGHERSREKKDKGVKNTELVSRHHHGAEVV